MITFGYNNKFSTILRALSAVAIGLVMVFSTEATVMVVKIIAAFLFAAGVVSFVHGYANRKNGAMSLMTVNAIVDIVIGLMLYFFPQWVAGAIVTLIGVVILIFGILQLIVLSGTMSLIGAGGFSLFLSMIAIIGGITLLFNPFSEKIMSVLAGVFLIFYGVSELVSLRRVTRAKEASEIKFHSEDAGSDARAEFPAGTKTDLSGVRDVEYEKVDEQ